MFWAKCSIESTSAQFLWEVQKPVASRRPHFHASNSGFSDDTTKRGPRPCILNYVCIEQDGTGFVDLFPTTEMSAQDLQQVMGDSLWPMLWPSISSDQEGDLERLRRVSGKEPFVINKSPDRHFQRYVLAVHADVRLSEIGQKIPHALLNEAQMTRLNSIAQGIVMCSDLRGFKESNPKSITVRYLFSWYPILKQF